ncbi:MAG: DUF3105 domain-containing protein [Actinomycetota bacterium]|nr:DUF3105 domain-containing protein [Actinomycetota bacterium]
MASVLVALVLGACADGGAGPGAPRPTASTGSAPCGAEVEEPLDPRSTQHLLPGAPEPAYANDPPTSGPHQVARVPSGVQAQPLPRPVQVGLLEEGFVLVQHRDLPDRDTEQLQGLATEMVVVAPLTGPGPPVVATAWRRRLSCTTVDLAALRAFIAAHRGKTGDGATGR